MEDGVVLQLGPQRPEDFDARRGPPFADEDGEVEGYAAFDLALQGGGKAESDDELVSGRALEGWRELLQRLLHAVGGEDLDFGGADRSRGHKSGDADDCDEECFDAHRVSL